MLNWKNKLYLKKPIKISDQCHLACFGCVYFLPKAFVDGSKGSRGAHSSQRNESQLSHIVWTWNLEHW